jgi:DNA adenine methylase
MEDMEKQKITTPLRYPGGKSKSLHKIIPHIRTPYDEFREPFVGGGSVFLTAIQEINPKARYKINDLNYDLFCFWKELKENGENLIEAIQTIRDQYCDGKKLFESLSKKESNTEFERALRFFVLNRTSFSGTTDCGGYSEESYRKRFTQSSIDRLKPFPNILKNVEINHGDYEALLSNGGTNVFIFLDPPYFKPVKSKLYGKNGSLHTSFNHERFAEKIKKCSHNWLITYDDCIEIRTLFSFAKIYRWKAQYGMNNISKDRPKSGKELIITNYSLKRRTPIKLENRKI